ncbi:Prefoldin subunit 3 [Chlorella vulgaris]
MAEEEAPSSLPQMVPAAEFMEDVNAHMQGRKAEDVITELRTAHQKYKYIEAEYVQRKRRLAFKLPEIQKCLNAVNLLLQRQEEGESTVLDFSLSDQVYARARVSDVASVNLWLGAGVMLEYPLGEAQALLERQLAGCKQQLKVVQWEHEYIKDQLTTTEVSMARVYNWDVQNRRAAAAASSSATVFWSARTPSRPAPARPLLSWLANPVPSSLIALCAALKVGGMHRDGPNRPLGMSISLSSQPRMMVHNTMSGPWPEPPAAGAVTPLTVKQLCNTPGFQSHLTPTTIPVLPLMSPSATPALGLGFGGLTTSCGHGQSLEQIMSVPTDPMSRHFIHLNMMEVEDLDHAAMDALMNVKAEEAGAALRRTPRLTLADSLTTTHLSPWPVLQLQLQLQSPDRAALLLESPDDPGMCSVASVTMQPPPLLAPPSAARMLRSGGPGAAVRPSSAASSDTAAHSPPRYSVPNHVGASAQGAQARARHQAVESGNAQTDSRAGGTDGGLATLSVTYLDENGYFDMTLREAAEQLGVGVTTLKKLCRQSGLGRWPYRARCSLRNLREKMREYFACAPSEEREAADALMEREFCRLAHMNVGAIDDAFKQFRQAMFKLEFKARQQLESNRSSAAAASAAVAAAANPEAGGDAVAFVPAVTSPRKRPHSAAAAPAAEGELSGVFHGDAAFRQQAMMHLRRLLHACSDGTY